MRHPERTPGDAGMSPTPTAPAAAPARLLASLDLGFCRERDTTRLVRRIHSGPLRVQKPLYPEGSDPCHAILVHPPGGIVGGDGLDIAVHAAAGAHAFLSTPGAAKWYRANGQTAHQHVRITVDDGAALEWMPQETILFNQADAVMDSEIRLTGSARYLGCEILCFGRTASGEQFTEGQVRQRLRIFHDERLLWLEQGRLDGESALMRGTLGLAGYTVCASLIAVGTALTPALLGEVRAACTSLTGGVGRVGATQLKSVLMVRYLGHRSEVARHLMLAAWRVIRPALLSREAVVPRIWNT